MIGQQRSSRPAPRVDLAWRNQASCRFTNPGLFFPAGSTGVAVGEIDAAKAIWGACQVQDRCLRFALETNQDHGIWGGTTEAERRKLRRVWLADRRRLLSQVNA